ncbi:hypothetical protein MHU86_9000 [Fragilaria crotonensis]|nr:hypothetical protein MHU86_9000 [Fragilaria crotonensis]
MLLMLSLVMWHGLANQLMKADIADEYPMMIRRGQQSGIAADVCSNQQRLLNRRVAMTLQDAGLNDLSPTKIRTYEKTFLTAYNRLRKGVCSSQLPLTVAAVKFVDDATSPKADFSDRVLKLVFQVTFRCKWCNSNTTLFKNTVAKRRLTTEEGWDREVAAEQHFYSHSTSADALDDFDSEIDTTTSPASSRNLQKKPSRSCQTCLPLTPERFTLRFNTELKKMEKRVGNLNAVGSAAGTLLPAWKWTELYLARCSNQLNQFETSFIIPFTGDSTKPATSEGLAVLAQGVLETINSFYVLRDGSCDSLFRVAVSSNAELLTSGALNRRELASTTLTIKVNVSYQCNGCSSGTTLLKNDAGRRRRQLESDNRHIDEQRNLAVTVGAGECYCPVGANDFEVPTRSEFSGALQETVTLLTAQGKIDFVKNVGNVAEVVEFDCTPPQQARQTGLILQACSGSSALSLEQQQAVADATEASWNELIVQNCDQESLAITDVRVIDTVTNGEGCTGTRYLFVVDFNCRDCEVDSKILSNSTGSRALLAWSPETGADGMSRRSLGETCVCDVNAVNKGRRMSEVRYSPSQLLSLVTTKLSASGLTLYGLSESSAALTCGEVIETSFLVECSGDPTLITPSGLSSFAQGVVDTVNSLYDSSAICDPFFRVAISAEAELVSSNDVYSNVRQRALATTSTRLRVKVNVSYQCKNCKSGAALLKNDASRRRRLDPVHHMARRSLFAISAGVDTCTCPEPPAGTPEFEIPSRFEFNDAFNKTLEDLKATNPEVNNFVASVGSTSEVVEYNCSAPVENRTTYMTLRACSSGRPDEHERP